MAKEQQLSPAREQEWFVICAQGDGPGTWVVPAEKLHETMHAQYCTCSKKWQDCTTEGVRQMVADLDDDDHWSHEYPDYARHVFTDHGEDYTLTVIRIQPSELDAYSAPLRQALQQQQKLREIGQKMANVLYNMKQDDKVPESWREWARILHEDWDRNTRLLGHSVAQSQD